MAILFFIRFVLIAILFLCVDAMFHYILTWITGHTVHSWADEHIRDSGLTFLFMTFLLTLLFNAWERQRGLALPSPKTDQTRRVDHSNTMLIAKYLEQVQTHTQVRTQTPTAVTVAVPKALERVTLTEAPILDERVNVSEMPKAVERVKPSETPTPCERVSRSVSPQVDERSDGKLPCEREPEEITTEELRRRLLSGEIKLQDIRTR